MFVELDDQNKVKGIYRQPQPGYAEEELADNHADIMVFEAKLAASPINSLEQRIINLEKEIALLKGK